MNDDTDYLRPLVDRLRAERDEARTRVAELEGALRPFAEFAPAIDNVWPDELAISSVSISAKRQLTIGDCHRARALLTPAGEPPGPAPRSPMKTCLDDTGLKITNELYKAVSGLTTDPCLLAMIGSWGDTLDDADILDGLRRYNEMGECFIPDVSATRRAGEDQR